MGEKSQSIVDVVIAEDDDIHIQMCIYQRVILPPTYPPRNPTFHTFDVAVAVILLMLVLVVLGKATNGSVCVAFAIPFVPYVALTGSLPSAITKCPSALSNDANEARGW